MQQLQPNESTEWKYGHKSYTDTKLINKWFKQCTKIQNANKYEFSLSLTPEVQDLYTDQREENKNTKYAYKYDKIPSLWLLK